MSFNFMAAITICSDLGAQENKVSVSIVFPSICREVMGRGAIILVFECWVLIQVFHSPLSPSSKVSVVIEKMLALHEMRCISFHVKPK